jgi:hypothetical protein
MSVIESSFEQLASAQESANHQMVQGSFPREVFRFQAPSAHCCRARLRPLIGSRHGMPILWI